MRAFLGATWQPVAVGFTHRPPRHDTIHHRALGPVVRFGEDYDGLRVHVRDLDAPNAMSDPILRGYARQFLGSIETGQRPTDARPGAGARRAPPARPAGARSSRSRAASAWTAEPCTADWPARARRSPHSSTPPAATSPRDWYAGRTARSPRSPRCSDSPPTATSPGGSAAGSVAAPASGGGRPELAHRRGARRSATGELGGYRVALLARRTHRIAALAKELDNGSIAMEADVTDRRRSWPRRSASSRSSGERTSWSQPVERRVLHAEELRSAVVTPEELDDEPLRPVDHPAAMWDRHLGELATKPVRIGERALKARCGDPLPHEQDVELAGHRVEAVAAERLELRHGIRRRSDGSRPARSRVRADAAPAVRDPR